jgi:hypothetical protein
MAARAEVVIGSMSCQHFTSFLSSLAFSVGTLFLLLNSDLNTKLIGVFGIGCDWFQRQKVVDTDRDFWEAGGKTHTAFVFIKPHAVYEKARPIAENAETQDRSQESIASAKFSFLNVETGVYIAKHSSLAALHCLPQHCQLNPPAPSNVSPQGVFAHAQIAGGTCIILF